MNRSCFFTVPALVLGVAAAACSHATETSSDVASKSILPAPPAPNEGDDAGSAPVPPLRPARIVAVTANGTGCPMDTFSFTIAEDGQSVSLRPHASDIKLDAGQALAINDCSFGIDVDGGDFAYAVATVGSRNFTSVVGEGVVARESFKAYFQGDPTVAFDTQFETAAESIGKGSHSTETGDAAVWSTCGLERRLNVTTRRMLRNNPAKTGHAFMGSSEITIALKSRPCSGG